MAKDQHTRGLTLRDELENLQKMFPIKNGVRIRARGERVNRNARAATLWTYLESNREGSHYALHETVFAKNEPKSDRWWSQYFATRVFKGWKSGGIPVQRMGILEGAIIPGVNIKTRKQWSVRAVIGYNLHDNVRAVYSKVHQGRH